MRRLLILSALAVMLVVPATAQARTSHFYNPNRGIECKFWPARQYQAMIACTTFANGRVAVINTMTRASVAYDDGSWGFQRGGSGASLYWGQSFTTPGWLRCKSHPYGMDCWSGWNGHGFVINRYGVNRY